MCGRFAASRAPEDLAGLFNVEKWESAPEGSEGPEPPKRLEHPEGAAGSSAGPLGPDWNVAPTKQVYAVLDRPVKGSGDDRPVRQLRALKWGLVPSWAKSPDMGGKLINARAETVHEKPAYRKPFTARRCILPADGYYEWVTAQGELDLEQEGRRKRPSKQPYFVTPADGSVMAMAGLYEFWRDATLPEGHPSAWWATCTVVTTAAETAPLANAGDRAADEEPPGEDGAGARGPRSLADIHPRMPLMLTPDRWDAWLDPARGDGEELRSLLLPPPEGLMRAYPVSKEVSNVRNNGAHLVKELSAPKESTLF